MSDQPYRDLADEVVRTLGDAGLPAATVRNAGVGFTGAAVFIDAGADDGPGLYVQWGPAEAVRSATRDCVSRSDFDNPAIDFDHDVREAMARAIDVVLTRAGFAVGEPANDLLGPAVQVFERKHPHPLEGAG